MSNRDGWSSIWRGMKGIGFGNETYMWKFYENLLGKYDFKGKRVLEMGCGTGINTMFMAKRGARVTFLDFSGEALDIVRRNMCRLGVDGELVLGDMFEHNFDGEFDFVHSEGVIEHFTGPARQQALDRHAEAARKGGRVLVVVPHMGAGAYRIGKYIAEKNGAWVHGKEYPYTKFELEKRFERSGLRVEKITGGELIIAWGWLFSPLWLSGGTLLERSLKRSANRWFFHLNYNNWFANQWGRVLGAVGVKK